MLITNGRIIIIPNNDIDELERLISIIRTNAQNIFNDKKIKFTYLDDPYPHFKNDSKLDFDQLQEACRPDIDLQFRAIGEETITLPGFKPREIKHVFSEEEKMDLGEKMANSLKLVEEIESEKKAAMAEFKARIEAAEQDVHEAGDAWRNGYEMRQMDVLVTIDYVAKKKYYIDPDSGNVLDIMEIDPADWQMQMKFEGQGFQQSEPGDAPFEETEATPEQPNDQVEENNGPTDEPLSEDDMVNELAEIEAAKGNI